VFTFFGFLPIYLGLKLLGLRNKSVVIASIGFAPVAISLANIFSVQTSIQHSYTIHVIVLLVNLTLLFLNLKVKTAWHWSELRHKLAPTYIGLLAGVVYWYYAFYPFTQSSSLYHDIIFNYSIISELRNNFLPIDSNWYSGSSRLYHFLADLYFAGMTNFSNLNVIQVVNIGNLFSCLSVFLIISFTVRGQQAANISLFVLLIFFNISSNWLPFSAFPGHMTGRAASTFFWSIPILLTMIYFWFDADNKRKTIDYSTKEYLGFVLFALILTLVGFYSKVTILPVLVGLELYAFTAYIYANSIFSPKMLMANLKTLSTYIFIPLFGLFLAMLTAWINKGGTETGLAAGLEIMDFVPFDSWNILYPIVAMYGVVAMFVILNYKKFHFLKFELLFASMVNFILFFTIKHTGSSDIYFAFNSIICNALFITYSDLDRKFYNVIFAFFITVTSVILIGEFTKIKGFTIPTENLIVSTEGVYGPSVYKNGEVEKYIQDMIDLTDALPVDSLIATRGYGCSRHFTFSAFIGRRFWNESCAYSGSTRNGYTDRNEFEAQQKFIPDFFTEKPVLQNESDARDLFVKSESMNYLKFYEDPEERAIIFNTAVFQNNASDVSDSIVKRFNWTHVLIENKDIDKINDWLKYKAKIESGNFTIFVM
jgi:hypothetical protein